MTAEQKIVAVVGSGYMGGGIAQTFALAGHQVRLADVSEEASRRAVERLVTEGEAAEADGLFDPGATEALADNLQGETLEAAVAGAEYITEAVPEALPLKLDVLAQIAGAAGEDAVIASNTSAIPIRELSEAVAAPERFLGAHWMNPSYFVPGVEVVPGPVTDPTVVDGVVRLLEGVGKVPTIVSDSPGFVANRLQFALYEECCRMVEEGVADPAQIDEVVQNSFGFRLPFFGPFAISDIAGLDVYAGSIRTMERDFGERFAVPDVLLGHVAEGRLGLKTGEGFYFYSSEAGELVRSYRGAAYARLAALRAELAARQPRFQPRRRWSALPPQDDHTPTSAD